MKGSPGTGREAEVMAGLYQRLLLKERSGSAQSTESTGQNPDKSSFVLVNCLIFSGKERNGNRVLHTPGKGTDQKPRVQNSSEAFSSEHALKGGGCS